MILALAGQASSTNDATAADPLPRVRSGHARKCRIPDAGGRAVSLVVVGDMCGTLRPDLFRHRSFDPGLTRIQ
jgi:hypothetical protein